MEGVIRADQEPVKARPMVGHHAKEIHQKTKAAVPKCAQVSNDELVRGPEAPMK